MSICHFRMQQHPKPPWTCADAVPRRGTRLLQGSYTQRNIQVPTRRAIWSNLTLPLLPRTVYMMITCQRRVKVTEYATRFQHLTVIEGKRFQCLLEIDGKPRCGSYSRNKTRHKYTINPTAHEDSYNHAGVYRVWVRP